jgi:23S rRNA (uracil1939-C5)-methyltransferase
VDGQKNAMKNHIENVEFVNAKVENFARDFAWKSGKADVIILDPPRDGLHPSAIPFILWFGANEIIYVSCNPATLSRDLELFVGKNRDESLSILPKYHITDIAPVDMFPHTHHIETVVRLEKII